MAGVKTLLSGAIVTAVLAASTVSPAFAWHPKGAIVKKVQNVTTNSALADANDISSAIAVKPGDIIRYVVEVRNDGAPDSRGYNDMAKTIMTDTLPAGVELAANPATRQITENIGLLKPGQKVTKEYTLKVTSQKDGDAIVNTACFTGDSTANDSPQKGCDVATIKVKVPVVPPKPEEPEKPKPEIPEAPKPQEEPEIPAELPATGLETVLGTTAGFGALIYAGYSYIRSRRIIS